MCTATRSELGDETTIEVVELRDYAHDITDHLLTGFANQRLRPLLSYLRAQAVPTAVYAASADWGSDTDLNSRITRAAGELAAAVQDQPAQQKADPFTDPVPFEQLLHDATARAGSRIQSRRSLSSPAISASG